MIDEMTPPAQERSAASYGLGPYAWPLVSRRAVGHQWSGNVGNWFAAETIVVKAGETVGHDEEPVTTIFV